MNTAADPRYLQVARALRQEIVDGVYPVGSQLPTEHALCDRFSVSRYTVREALRRLREDNLISSKPRAGTMVVPRTSTSSYAQDVMSIDDLMAFASGAHLVIQASRMLTVDADLAQRTGLAVGQEWLGIGGYRQADGASHPVCFTEYYINREFASVGRLLHRHNGPVFPLIEDMFGRTVTEVHQEISAVLMRTDLAARLDVDPGTAALEVRRTYITSDGETAQVTINTHPASRYRYSMTLRRISG